MFPAKGARTARKFWRICWSYYKAVKEVWMSMEHGAKLTGHYLFSRIRKSVINAHTCPSDLRTYVDAYVDEIRARISNIATKYYSACLKFNNSFYTQSLARLNNVISPSGTRNYRCNSWTSSVGNFYAPTWWTYNRNFVVEGCKCFAAFYANS